MFVAEEAVQTSFGNLMIFKGFNNFPLLDLSLSNVSPLDHVSDIITTIINTVNKCVIVCVRESVMNWSKWSRVSENISHTPELCGDVWCVSTVSWPFNQTLWLSNNCYQLWCYCGQDWMSLYDMSYLDSGDMLISSCIQRIWNWNFDKWHVCLKDSRGLNQLFIHSLAINYFSDPG